MTRDELITLGLTEPQADAVSNHIAALTEQITQLTERVELDDKRTAALGALPAHSPRDPQLILRLLDFSKIRIEDGEIQGLNPQVEALKAASPYLFFDAADPSGGQPTAPIAGETFDMNAFLRGER